MIFNAIISILLITITSILLFFVGYILIIAAKRHKYRHLPTLPYTDNYILGHLSVVTDSSIRLTAFSSFHHPLCVLVYYHTVDVMILDTKLGRSILMAGSRRLIKPKIYEYFDVYGQSLMSRGLVLISNPAAWLPHRLALNACFTHTALQRYILQFNRGADRLVNRFANFLPTRSTAFSSDEPRYFSLIDEFSDVIFDLIFQVAFNWSTDGSDPDIPSDIRRQFCACLYLVRDSMYDPWHKWKPHRYAQQNRAIQTVKSLRDIFRKKLRQRQAELESVEGEDYDRENVTINRSSNGAEDVLTSLARLGLRENATATSAAQSNEIEERLIDDITAIIVGGFDTTAAVLSFAVLELSRRPEIVRRIRTELDEIMGNFVSEKHQNRNQPPINLASNETRRMTYLNAVIKETNRFHTIVGGSSRVGASSMSQIKNLTINYDGENQSYSFPANTEFNVDLIECNRRMFVDGDEFRPERFLSAEDDDEMDSKPVEDFFSFSLGPRRCLGREYFKLESLIMLAKLLHRFDFNRKADVIEKKFSFIIQPNDNGMVAVTERNDF